MQHRKILFTAIGVLSYLFLLAQPKFNSPWSRIGLGELNSGVSNPIYLSGGLGAAYYSDHFVNIQNPASLSYLRATGFEFGVNGGAKILSSDNEELTQGRGALDYITLAFPLRNPIGEILERKKTDWGWSMGLDLRTVSRVGYDIQLLDSLPDIGRFDRIFQGSGGTYKFGWSNAVRYKQFSAGLEIGVLFGNIKATQALSFRDLQNPADDIFIDEIGLRGFHSKLGLMYRHVLNEEEDNTAKRRYLSVGSYAQLNSNFSTSGTRLYRTIRQNVVVRDTVIFEDEIDGEGTYPGIIGFGLMYDFSNQFQVGLNYEFSDWTSFDGGPLDSRRLKSSSRIGAGFTYIPDPNAFGKYFKRVQYRGGIQFYKDPRTPNDDQLNAFTVTAGMTMPFYFIRQVSYVHLGFEYTNTYNDSDLKEQYFGIRLGATFTDNQWFYKRKFN